MISSLYKIRGQYTDWSHHLGHALSLANRIDNQNQSREPILPKIHGFLVWLEVKTEPLALARPMEVAKLNNLALIVSQIDLLLYETYQYNRLNKVTSPSLAWDSHRLLFDDIPTLSDTSLLPEQNSYLNPKKINYLTGGVLAFGLILFFFIYQHKIPFKRTDLRLNSSDFSESSTTSEDPISPIEQHTDKESLPINYSQQETEDHSHKEEWISDKIPQEDEEIPNHEENNGQHKMRKELFTSLIAKLEGEKLYLDPELNLNKLKTLLQTNKRYLYEAISTHTNCNFKDLVNAYKVDEAKRIIGEIASEKLNTETSKIYLQAGFNSMTSYYRVFKKHTGVTPNQYAKDYKAKGMP